jgi:formylglycine-generating enzyme required for sulfatase activity
MVYIPGGKFIMGSPFSENTTYTYNDEKPQHEVTVPSYWMGKYAVTQEQWEAVMGNNPSEFQGAKRPVDLVSWDDCQEFCQKLSLKTGKDYRLPSEAEWEYGCRAGTTTAFHTGETITTDLANYCGNSLYGNCTYLEEGKGLDRNQTVEVGTFPPNNFGLYEMHGNVEEWCEDGWHDNYREAPIDGRAWTDNHSKNDRRVLRGGAWNFDPRLCRSADRDDYYRDLDSNGDGFRLVCLVGRTF